MRLAARLLIVTPILWLVSCTPPPPVAASRDVLWEQYAHQPVDKVLLTMGTPERETRLTDGSRMVTYQHSTIYDAGTPTERQTGCEVTFMAQSPHYRVENIAMEGEGYECNLLAQGHTGSRRIYIPPPQPYIPYPYYRYPY